MKSLLLRDKGWRGAEEHSEDSKESLREWGTLQPEMSEMMDKEQGGPKCSCRA